MEIVNKLDGRKGLYEGTINDKCISYIRFIIHGRNLDILTIETDKGKRHHGYATELLNELINEYGGKYDINLSCMPFGITIDKTYKGKQERLSKFYEKFGFVTIEKEEYSDIFQWKMSRVINKKENK